jgi:hypothetical protein
MKYILSLCIVLFLASMLHAQDSKTTSDQTEGAEEYTETSSGYDEYEETPTHTLVEPGNLPQTRSYSTEKITVRKFDPAKWKKVAGSKSYTSDENRKRLEKPEEDNSMRGSSEDGQPSSGQGKQRIRRAQEDDPEDYADGSPISLGPGAGLLIQIIFYAIIIVVIGLILFFIIKNMPKGAAKTDKIGWTDDTLQVEDIATLDVDTHIQQHINAGNYRMAIRMYFLGLLKKLNEDGFIVWKKDKTNRDYLTELFAQNHYQEVRRLTLAYEQVWYGDHTFATESYKQLIDEFIAIDQKLKTRSA